MTPHFVASKWIVIAMLATHKVFATGAAGEPTTLEFSTTVPDSVQIENLVLSPTVAGDEPRWQVVLRVFDTQRPSEMVSLRLELDGTYSGCRRVLAEPIEEQLGEIRSASEDVSLADVARRIRFHEIRTRCSALQRSGKRFARLRMPTLVKPYVIMDSVLYEFAIEQPDGVDTQVALLSGDVDARGENRHPLIEWGLDLRRTILECSAAADGKP